MRAIVLIDGEHYLPVTKWAIETEVATRFEVVGAVFIGGTEKIGTKDDLEALGIPVVFEGDPLRGIEQGISQFSPDIVVDLSDEPIVGYEDRFRFANLIIHMGVIYAGADFRFDPPLYRDMVRKPAISVVGMGKRTGKTAACAHVARVLSGQEGMKPPLCDPLIVTMGRGGPLEPELVEGRNLDMTPEYLLSMADQGKHAASDHFEDALTTRLTTIGSRRCGGGFAGKVFASNIEKSVELANNLPEDLILFEGSGASMPPVRSDAEILIIGAHQPLDHIAKYMGPYRVMRADLIIITMCEPPMADLGKIQQMETLVRQINNRARVVRTVFRPRPLQDIDGATALLVLTAPPRAVPQMVLWLESNYGCRIAATSTHLANRPILREDIRTSFAKHPDIDTLLSEVKAAGIDVATRLAKEADRRVVYIDNILREVGEDRNLPQFIKETAQLAIERHAARIAGAD